MKCPKCQYVGFESGERCRNCGYEFALAVDESSADLPIGPSPEPSAPLADFSMTPVPPETRPPATAFDLPLFGDDAPLVTPPAVPRAPLAVRRHNPGLPRTRAARAGEPALDLEPDVAEPVPAPVKPSRAAREDLAAFPSEVTPPLIAAGAGPRLLAALLDLTILGGADAVIIYLTLRWTGLAFEEIHLMPVAPMAGFLALIDGGYLVCFTVAGGQTIGKMTAGIRVVRARASTLWEGRVPLGTAVLRAAATLVSLLPAGLGFVPALVGERRAVHDRLADTRVVNA